MWYLFVCARKGNAPVVVCCVRGFAIARLLMFGRVSAHLHYSERNCVIDFVGVEGKEFSENVNCGI